MSEGPKLIKGKEITQYSEKINEFYTNSAHLIMSENDLIIEFGFKVIKNDERVTTISNRAIMSPNQAKKLTETLILLIEQYDKKEKAKK